MPLPTVCFQITSVLKPETFVSFVSEKEMCSLRKGFFCIVAKMCFMLGGVSLTH